MNIHTHSNFHQNSDIILQRSIYSLFMGVLTPTVTMEVSVVVSVEALST